MIVVEKPSGMPSVPGLDGMQSLLEYLQEWPYDKSTPKRCESPSSGQSIPVISSEQSIPAVSSGQSELRHLHVVHRLDMDTSGVMLFAKTHEAAVNLRRQFEEHTVQKTYMARVCAPEAAWNAVLYHTEAHSANRHKAEILQTINLPLSPDYDERPRQKVDFKQGKAAHTEYEIIKTYQDGTADLLLYPHTGRTHQLRVHCAHTRGLGRPILGDLLYGAYSVDGPKSTCPKKAGNRHSCLAKPSVPERLCLHALSITFRHPHTGERLTFTSRQLCY
jgi:tRNA pseudouridine32 synthase/23S rRNA pseudouridine746 synthase